jgi:hypothetical protein
MFKGIVLLVWLVTVATPSAMQTQRSSYSEIRTLLSSMSDVQDSDSLAELFKLGDEHITDLIKLLNEPDESISRRAQIVIRYLDNEAGMRALDEYYAKPGVRLMAGPKALPSNEAKKLPLGEKNLAKLVEENCSCLKSADKEYAHTRVLALTTKGDKALVEIYINRGVLMEEWYHVVIKKTCEGWQLVSVYRAGQS